MNLEDSPPICGHFQRRIVDGKYQAVPRGVPEGGTLPDQLSVRVHNLYDGTSWLEMPPPGSVSVPGGDRFTLEDYVGIPLAFDDGEPEVPTWWQKVKSRMFWKWAGLRSRVAQWIYPEAFDDDWY